MESRSGHPFRRRASGVWDRRGQAWICSKTVFWLTGQIFRGMCTSVCSGSITRELTVEFVLRWPIIFYYILLAVVFAMKPIFSGCVDSYKLRGYIFTSSPCRNDWTNVWCRVGGQSQGRYPCYACISVSCNWNASLQLLQEWHALCLQGTFLMGQAFAKLLADKNCDRGAIVNISSIAGKVCKFTFT